ncbi:hypothetical protein HN51_060118 [Arachis hypogaea]
MQEPARRIATCRHAVAPSFSDHSPFLYDGIKRSHCRSRNARALPVALRGTATIPSPFHSRFAVHCRSPLSSQFADRYRSPPPLAIASLSITAAFQKFHQSLVLILGNGLYVYFWKCHSLWFGAGIACAAFAFTLGKVVEVTGVTELETDETELNHIVELDLVFHSLNSSMLGVVVVRYK